MTPDNVHFDFTDVGAASTFHGGTAKTTPACVVVMTTPAIWCWTRDVTIPSDGDIAGCDICGRPSRPCRKTLIALKNARQTKSTDKPKSNRMTLFEALSRESDDLGADAEAALAFYAYATYLQKFLCLC